MHILIHINQHTFMINEGQFEIQKWLPVKMGGKIYKYWRKTFIYIYIYFKLKILAEEHFYVAV